MDYFVHEPNELEVGVVMQFKTGLQLDLQHCYSASLLRKVVNSAECVNIVVAVEGFLGFPLKPSFYRAAGRS